MSVFIVIVVFLLLLLMGQYISSVLLAAGILGLFLLDGMGSVGGFLQSEPFGRTASHTLTTIPLFILMAQFIMKADIVKIFYNLIFRISKGSLSLLGVLTIFLGGLLGAVSGSGTATSAALGQVAAPELKRRGFPEGLAGTIAASAGSLSAIIPPSIFLIIYGVVTQTSIAELFTAAIIPGVLLMVVFSIVTYIYLKFFRKDEINEESNEETDETVQDEEDEVSVFQYAVIIISGLIIAATIFGGIYSGFFTPTEAGAVGAFISLILAIILGKFNKNFLMESLIETSKVTVMAMLIVIGAAIFGRYISLSLLPRKIINLLGPLTEYPILLLFIILAFYFILFQFIEGIAGILMTVPIILPIIQEINVDVMWFGILVAMISTIGMLTPPVGISVYTVGSAAKISIERIFPTAIVFAFVATIVVGGIMIIFPETVTWLPSTMR